MNLQFVPRRRTASATLGVTSGLRRRLFVLLLVPLLLLAIINAWFDYRAAGSVAGQQDQRLLGLLPLLADSIIGEGQTEGAPPVMLLAPPMEEFMLRRSSAYAVCDLDGAAAPTSGWVHAKVTGSSGAGAEVVSGDVRLLTGDGRVAAEVRGLRVKRTTASALRQVRPADDADLMFRLEWRETGTAAVEEEKAAAGTWVVLENGSALGAKLAARIESAGARCISPRASVG